MTSRTLIATICIGLALASAATAQDISFKMSEIAAGSTVTIRNSDGKTFTHQHLGKTGRHYSYRTFEGASPAGTPIITWFTNARGELVRQVQNGQVRRWSPHRCMRTLGQCKYTETRPDGTRIKRVRVTEATKNGFKYGVYTTSGELVLSGWAEIDAKGWTTRGAFQPVGDRKITLKMVASDYK